MQVGGNAYFAAHGLQTRRGDMLLKYEEDEVDSIREQANILIEKHYR